MYGVRRKILLFFHSYCYNFQKSLRSSIILIGVVEHFHVFNSITGLPSTGSWQDLKDHMREAGDVCYADVHKDGTGVVEFLRHEDMKYAVKKLDDSRFRSHEVTI